MSCNLHPCARWSSSAPADSSKWRSRNFALRFLLPFSASPPHSHHSATSISATNGNGNQDSSRVVLVERYSNGTSKRYFLNGKSSIKTVTEDQRLHEDDELQDLDSYNMLSRLPFVVKDFILPAGFPGSVSDDYLEYMLWQFPTNVTGWICHALVTSSLLKAVGVGSLPGTATATSAAAIRLPPMPSTERWVSKDGIGAIGRLIIGGRFGSLFDDDPKQWRMYADFIGSAGSIFDLSTQLYPAYFLPLASLGNLTKAIARGLKDPSSRVIQNHFSVRKNLGEIAAKEEVWEVSAQLLGLSLGVLILDTPGLVKSFPIVASTWLSVRLVHLWLRYQSLSVLTFETINLKRARQLAKAHVLHHIVPGCLECNREESILSWQQFLKPRIIFGASLEEMLSTKGSSLEIAALLKLYASESYILTVDKQPSGDPYILVSFKQGATSSSALRSVWQSYWISENWDNNSSEDVMKVIEQSLIRLSESFDHFFEQLESGGWDTDQITIKVPKDLYIEEIFY